MTAPDSSAEVITPREYEALLDAARRIEEGRSRETAEASMDCDYGHDVIDELLTTLAQRAYQRGFTEGGEEALTSALHPEFGTEWRGPDGVIWKEYHRGMAEGARQVLAELEDTWWPVGLHYVDAVREAVARIEKGAGA